MTIYPVNMAGLAPAQFGRRSFIYCFVDRGIVTAAELSSCIQAAGNLETSTFLKWL